MLNTEIQCCALYSALSRRYCGPKIVAEGKRPEERADCRGRVHCWRDTLRSCFASATMIPTVVRMSKASRRPLTSKMANKDYYKGAWLVSRLPNHISNVLKGTRQAWLQPDLRTGPPGKHTKHGGYRLIEEQVRVFVAPPLKDIDDCKVRDCRVSRCMYR